MLEAFPFANVKGMTSPRNSHQLTDELKALLGADGFVRLAEAFGGERLEVPKVSDGSRLEETMGSMVAARLCERYGSRRISVPLARAERAHRYLEAGMGRREVAKALGLTRSGLNRMLDRCPSPDVMTSSEGVAS